MTAMAVQKWIAGERNASATWSTHSPVLDDAPVTRDTCPSAESNMKPTASATPTIRPDHQAGDTATKATRPIAEKHTETKLTKFGVHPEAAQAAATTRAAPRLTHRM